MSSPATESSPSSTISWWRTSPSDSRRPEVLEQLDVVADGAEFRGDPPGRVGVVPQIGPRDLLLELGPAFPEVVEAEVALGLVETGPQRRQFSLEVALLAGTGCLASPRHGTA